MKRGTGKHPVTPGAVVNIVTDAEFTVYALEKGVRASILGPNHSTERRFKIHIPVSVNQIEVTTRKSGRWIVTETIRASSKEVPDPTPVEIGVKGEEDSHADYIRRIVEDVVSKHAELNEAETFEEANDFDVGDQEPTSPYEITEMQEEAAPPEPPTKTEEPSASCPAASVEDSDPPVPAETTETPPFLPVERDPATKTPN